MEKVCKNLSLSNETLANSIYQDVSANFRIKVEASKKQLEKVRRDGQLRDKVCSNFQFISMVK